jgi:hypothetical protein
LRLPGATVSAGISSSGAPKVIDAEELTVIFQDFVKNFALPDLVLV